MPTATTEEIHPASDEAIIGRGETHPMAGRETVRAEEIHPGSDEENLAPVRSHRSVVATDRSFRGDDSL